MIPVDRNSVPAPLSLTSATGQGATERAQVITHYGTANCATFKFKAYKEKDVVSALNTLFKEKCAYCESRITNSGPTDIDHFRPKGAVAEDPTHPGYWWLASEWTNLLPSCIDCNRKRYQVITHENNIGKTQGETLSGKKDSFPIIGIQRAICASDNHTLEDPLLIDPTSRNPLHHIFWNFDNSEPLATAHPQDQYGQTSIITYGLNRIKLAEARKGVLLLLKSEIINIKKLVEKISILPTDQEELMTPLLSNMIDALYEKAKPDQQFSSCSRKYINEELKIIYEQMRQLNIQLKSEWS